MLGVWWHVLLNFLMFTHSKEDSGFMAVPLVHKGVVVVAVDYDIAPKGIEYVSHLLFQIPRIITKIFSNL